MSPKMRYLESRKAIRLIMPFAGLIAVGLIGRYAYAIHLLPWHIADALFEAFIVAGLLGIVIELSSVNQIIEHTADELASRLIGHGLPRQLQAVMSETLQTGLVMRDCIKAYRFSERADGAFDIEMTMEWCVVNYANHPLEYKPHLSEETIYDPAFLRLEYGPVGNEHVYDEAQLKTIVEPGKGGRAIVADAPAPVSIAPVRDDPESPDCCRVFWKFTVRMPREYSDIVSFGRPTLGVTIRLDDGPANLRFVAGGRGMPDGVGTSRKWVSTSAFLNSQHVRVWWYLSA